MDTIVVAIDDQVLRIGRDGSAETLGWSRAAPVTPDVEAIVGRARLRALGRRTVGELVESGALLRALSLSGNTEALQEFYYRNLAELRRSTAVLPLSES